MSAYLDECSACRNCNAHFLNSSLWYETAAHLKLHCGICDLDYFLPNTESQRNSLKNKYGKVSQFEQLIDFNQLRIGDVIAYKRKVIVFKYQHHALVTRIDKLRKVVTVVEFTPHLPLKKGIIVRSERHFNTDIKPENAWVRRYMPLDCLPVPQALMRANAFVEDRDSQPAYDLTRFNCQHATSYCKTGVMVSDEANQVRRYYAFIFHSVQIFSVFINPVITLVMSSTDTVIRLGRIYRTELDLIRKELATWDLLLKDYASIGITTVAGVAAIAMVVAGRK